MIREFYAKLCDLSNHAFSLSEEYSNFKLVKKFLRSPLERFSIKVSAIEEAKDLESLKIDELIGSLQTFKLNLDESKKVKSKRERSIALQVVDEMSNFQYLYNEELQEHIDVLT
ncbi:hypothetical protein CXB51_028939 [Gossypium anomalum]|uniref:Gag-pol polyprotein n=1 Tax=Gossypium anomalum TaxID=47600 RepID=A0A8J5Y7S3_9ROSI|nr:hypothetical protein CXB51_028939 [Gossypium anomalum]